MKQHFERQGGFTLVELLIVVIILALLSAIVVPQFAASTDDAKSSAADTSLSNLRAALDLYYQQHGEYPGANTAVPTSSCGGTTSGAGVATGGAGATAAAAFLEQLSMYTDADGGACSKADANHKFGPYMKKPQLENEPFGESNALEVVADADLDMSATSGDPGGYKYDSQTGKIMINIAAESGR